LSQIKGTNEALRLFHRVVELDPDFASAYGAVAYCHVWRKVNGGTVNYDTFATQTRAAIDRM